MCVVIDLDVVCLICLQPSKEMHPIFTTDGDDAELQIAQQISILSELKIDQNNRTLPRKICNKCLQDLKAAWRFRKNCQAAVTIFQTIVKLGGAQLESAAPRELAEQKIKVPHGLEIKRIKIDNDGEENEKGSESLALEKPDTEEDFMISEEKAESPLYEELESNSCEGNQDIENPEFQTLEEADGNDEQKEEFEDDGSNFVEYYITDDGTTDESTRTHQKNYKIDAKDKHTNAEKLAVDIEKQRSNIKVYTIETSNKPATRGRSRKPNLLQKGIANSPTVVQRKTKGIVIVDSTNSSEETTQSEIRQVKTRKRKSLSAEIKSQKICDLCGNSYRYQHALNAHMRRHYNDKPFPCECCEKAFVSNVELRRHMRVHTGQKPYACQYCERRFSDFGSRIKHERTHTGERPYHCITCGKSFAYPHVLSVHVLTHTGEKRFRCDYCTKGFTKKAYLISHINQHHSGSIDDTMDNSQSHGKSGNLDESVYSTEMASNPIDEAEEYDDSFQDPGEIIITHSVRQPKLEVNDERERQEAKEHPDEFTITGR